MEKMAQKYKELLEKVLSSKEGALSSIAEARRVSSDMKPLYSTRSPLALDDAEGAEGAPTEFTNPGVW